MDSQLPRPLRTHRRRWALSQRDLGELLGVVSNSTISRYEASKREPSLRAVVGAAILFNQPTADVFPSVYQAVSASLISRARAMLSTLDPTPRNARKRELLESVIARLEANQ